MPVKVVSTPITGGESRVAWEDGIIIDQDFGLWSVANGYTSTTENVRDWQRRLRQGTNATGAMTASGVDADVAGLSHTIVYTPEDTGTPTSTSLREGLQGTSPPSPNFDSLLLTAQNYSKTQFYKNAIAARRLLQGGVILGELKDVLRMIKSPAKSLFKATDRYFNKLASKRGRIAPKDKLKVLADTYLEYTYGVQPLISDAVTAAEALNESIHRYKRETNVFRSTWKEEQVQVDDPYNVTLGAHSWNVKASHKRQDISKYLGALASTCPSPMQAGQDTARALGLAIEDFVPTLWELCPLSFLIDYFTNVSEVLDAWSARDIQTDWVQETRISRTFTERTLENVSKEWLESQGFKVLSDAMSPGVYRRTVFEINRLAAGAASILPGLTFEIPGVRQTFNISALLASRQRLVPF